MGKNAKGSRTKGVCWHCFFEYSLLALILLIFFRVRFFWFCLIYMHLNSVKVDWSVEECFGFSTHLVFIFCQLKLLTTLRIAVHIGLAFEGEF